MKVRELLQIELWSKRTTWKILVGIGIVIAGLFGWAAVQQYWISPGERKTGKDALQQIEMLKHLDPEKDKDFDLRVQQAKQKVDIARNTAWTFRDKLISFDLSMYLVDTEMGRKLPGIKEKLLKRRASQSESSQRLLEELNSVNAESNNFSSKRLHNALD